ncbi:ABC transporter substrate-binding protein [Microbacterium sp. Au-Mic1]|uniref:ABC transporter substrate-binding protein n=1 Tax=Microbacterium sp. Au-Mic1 TaxID=2906457 RepID=UPI001E62D3CD|nr:ABC transporter substrate-binding protein [Microbacterium sp. Au-Mic1]MCE4027604.1 ABC transporter substrate-binding protein [Microbacterium sp. Au-Mic1]
MKRVPLAIAAAVAAVLALTSCSGGGGATTQTSDAAAVANAPDDLNIGNFLDVTSWDPALADIGFDGPYLSAVYDALVALDKDGKPVPALAEKWEVASDDLSITLTLHKGGTFSDGTPVDADAVVKSLDYLKAGARSGEAYTNVSSFEAVDDHTVKINLTQRDDTILYFMGLGRSYVMSPKAIAAGTLGKQPVGSGPYTLDGAKSVAGSEYHFTKVPGYWDAKAYSFKNLAIFPIMDATARQNAMLSGQINVQYGDITNKDAAQQQGWNTVSRVSGWAGLVITDHTGAKNKALGDLKVRQALNYAFDGAAILKAVGSGAGAATNQVFPDGGSINDPSLNKQYAYNVDKAKQLLTEAGYPNGFDISMPMSPVFEQWKPAADQALTAIGVKVTWDNMQMPDYQLNAPNYPMFISFLAMDGNEVATVARQVTSKQWFNPAPDYASNAVLAPLVKKVQETKGADQTAAIKDLNKALVDQAWWSVWYQADNTYYSVSGIKVQPVIGMMFPTLRYITKG